MSHKEVLSGSAFLKKAGSSPTRFLEMVHASNARQPSKTLLQKAVPSDGLTTLWEMHMLDRSIEAMALLPGMRRCSLQTSLQTHAGCWMTTASTLMRIWLVPSRHLRLGLETQSEPAGGSAP